MMPRTDAPYEAYCSLLDGMADLVSFQCRLMRFAMTMHGHREAIDNLGAVEDRTDAEALERLDARAFAHIGRYLEGHEPFGPMPTVAPRGSLTRNEALESR